MVEGAGPGILTEYDNLKKIKIQRGYILMSIQFEKSMNAETRDFILRAFGEKVVVMDDKNALLENFEVLDQKVMKEVAKTAKQPATVGIHGEGDVVKMSDGTEYIVTPHGWRKKRD